MGKIEQCFDKMPAELLDQPRWIPVTHEKKPKLKGWEKPENQLRYDKVERPAAFVISAGESDAEEYLVFDFDHVLGEDGEFITTEAEDVCIGIWNDTGGTFLEFSQSGNGLHAFCKPTPGIFPNMTAMSHKLYLDDRTDLPEKERAKLELFYKSKRCIILTGNKLEEAPDTIVSGEPADTALRTVLEKIEEQKGQANVKTNVKSQSEYQETSVRTSDNLASNPTDIKRAKDMLDYIDPSDLDYQSWLTVGMVLKNIGAPLELWDEWSKQDKERYNKNGQTCERKWKSFNRDGVTIATLCKMAKENGYNEHSARKTSATSKTPVSVKEDIYSIDMGEYLTAKFDSDLEVFRTVSKIKTGFQNLDDAIDGVGPGLYVLGAIPSLGKTTLMHQMADNMAMAGEHVLYFSLEQEPFELASKSVARESYKISKESALTEWGIQRGYDDSKKQEMVRKAQSQYQEAIGNRLKIISGIHNVSIDDIVISVEDFIKRTGNSPVVIIDYLQKVKVVDSLSDKQRIDHITSTLKQLQSRNKIALFVISSFNRANYMQVADFESFKESGDIEYSADAVWALQLKILSDPIMSAQETGKSGTTRNQKRLLVDKEKNLEPRRVELVALKHRGHQLYRVEFFFHGSHAFIEPAPDTKKHISSSDTSSMETVTEQDIPVR